ncbi:MAG: acyl-[ACP]--phospholipid O-acyltransferase [Gammaproteobacteria bacterium]|nr:MAG: acyl-[ACP]--phospholipid O-acyltransferase [Gammaproteobacteria bacterium]
MIRLLKFSLRCLLRLLYRVRAEGMENFHLAGDRVLIVANHSSLLDGVLLYAWLPETPTFAINTRIAQKKQFRFFLRFVDLFVMDTNSPLSVKSMVRMLRQNKKAVIFPEGRITVTGTLMKIYEGPGLVADKAGALVLPIVIDGAHLSPFSYMKGLGRVILFPRINIRVLPPQRLDIAPNLTGHERRIAATLAMQDIMYQLYYSAFDTGRDLFTAFLQACEMYGCNSVILEDFNREPLSYRQLLTRLFTLSRLLKQDTANGEHVGLLLPNTNATVVCFLALQYLGRIPAMLNYTAGIQALGAACATGKIDTIYTSKRFIESAGLEKLAVGLNTQIRLVYLEDLRGQLTLADKLAGLALTHCPRWLRRRPVKLRNPDSPAVILFTSGSEGSPKGVVLSHRNILANYAQVRCHINFSPSDTVFTCLPLFHSFGLNAGTLMPLLGGSKVFIYPTPLHYRIIPELIYEIEATILFGTSTFFKGYAHHAHPYDFRSLRFTVAGAEKLREDTLHLWMEKFGIRILEGYGVTETSPVLSVNTPIMHKPGSVGRILPGIKYYLEPVAGIQSGGRLVVQGPNIMLGYLLPDSPGKIVPPQTSRGIGWHDTGDIADIDAEGYIHIQGRARRFAKLGGEMVSLTVVEELAMQTWPGFNHAAINLPDEKKGEIIILVTDYRQADRKQLQDAARRLHHSELSIPKHVLIMEELPILGTGKINYIRLAELVSAEDLDGHGWLAKFGGLLRKPGHEEAAAGGHATRQDGL